MIIAREKKKQNIIEYILYMWQVEDLIRAFNLDMERVSKYIVNAYEQPEPVKIEISEWYDDQIKMMISEKCQEHGHLTYLTNLVNDLERMHSQLISSGNEKKYVALFTTTRDAIEDLKTHSGKRVTGDVEAALNGLYGYLVLKLQKKEISSGTREAIHQISEWLAWLAGFYKKQHKDEEQ